MIKLLQNKNLVVKKKQRSYYKATIKPKITKEIPAQPYIFLFHAFSYSFWYIVLSLDALSNISCASIPWTFSSMSFYSNFTIIMVILFWVFLMFYQIFLFPQVKQSKIISNKHGIYKMPHEMLNDVKLRILGNSEISIKSQNFIELFFTSSFCQY